MLGVDILILILTGTAKPFPRLLEAVSYCVKNNLIKEEVMAQIGVTNFKDKNIKTFDFVTSKELSKLIDEASIIITHGGVGTIIDCLKKNKKILAVPRLKKYKEVANDHQIQIINEFGNKGYIIPVYDLSNLSDKINEAKTFKPNIYKSNKTNFVKEVRNYIDSL